MPAAPGGAQQGDRLSSQKALHVDRCGQGGAEPSKAGGVACVWAGLGRGGGLGGGAGAEAGPGRTRTGGAPGWWACVLPYDPLGLLLEPSATPQVPVL